MQHRYLYPIVEWWKTQGGKNLAIHIDETIQAIESDTSLELPQKKLMGLMLFSFSMHFGPEVFTMISYMAKEIDVSEQLQEYAMDWVNSKTV
jgi:hypothetical protein